MYRLQWMEASSVVLACAVIGGAILAGSCGCTQLEYRNPAGGTFYYWSSRDTSLEGSLRVDPQTGEVELENMNVSGQASPVVTANWTGFNEGFRIAMNVMRAVVESEQRAPAKGPENRSEQLLELLWKRVQADLDQRIPRDPPEPVAD